MMVSQPQTYSWGFQWENEDGNPHRLDGPAVIFTNHEVERVNNLLYGFRNYRVGQGHWCINGYFITEHITEWAEERNIDLDNLSDIDKAAIVLEWGNYKEFHSIMDFSC
jgi:hypothetical protein